MKTKHSTSVRVLGIASCVKYIYEYSRGSYDTPESHDVEILGISMKGAPVYNVISRYDSIYPQEAVLKGITDYIINEHTNN